MSRTTRNRRKKANRRGIIPIAGFDYWEPLRVNTTLDTYANPDGSMGVMAKKMTKMFTCFPCEETYGTRPHEVRRDMLSQPCDHHDNDRGIPGDNPHYMCEGTYWLLTDGSSNEHYGPRMCTKCNDQHENCMRVKCNKCGDITRRYRWVMNVMYEIKVENPRRMVMWTQVT